MEEGEQQKSKAAGQVRRRHVFYFSGYDPRGPSHYHKLYTEESAKQASLNGLDLEVGKRRKVGPLSHAWEIEDKNSGTRTTYEFLRWDDLIRAHWPNNELALLRVVLTTWMSFLASGLIGKLRQISRPFALAVSYPYLGFMGVLWLAVLMTLLLLLISLGPWLPLWVGLVGVVLIPAGAIACLRWLDAKLHLYWLIRISSAMERWANGHIPEIDVRIKDFAAHMKERIQSSDPDEVLLAGHSAGTILTVPLVAELLRADPELGASGPNFALLTLGSCIPLVSLLPKAERMRADLKTVAEAEGIHWFDFSGKSDGASVSRVDPLQVSGIERAEGKPVRPIHRPMRIPKMFSSEDYAELKKDLFRLHFQYLMSSSLQTDYDYFAITAGPASITERLADPVSR